MCQASTPGCPPFWTALAGGVQGHAHLLQVVQGLSGSHHGSGQSRSFFFFCGACTITSSGFSWEKKKKCRDGLTDLKQKKTDQKSLLRRMPQTDTNGCGKAAAREQSFGTEGGKRNSHLKIGAIPNTGEGGVGGLTIDRPLMGGSPMSAFRGFPYSSGEVKLERHFRPREKDSRPAQYLVASASLLKHSRTGSLVFGSRQRPKAAGGGGEPHIKHVHKAGGVSRTYIVSDTTAIKLP